MKRMMKLAIFGVILAALNYTSAFAQEQKQLTLRVVSTKDFCSKLTESFQRLGLQRGFSEKKSFILASVATTKVIDELRMGRATDFINTAALGELTSAGPNFETKFLHLTTLISNAMDATGSALNLALSAGELRFIPHAQVGSHIIVLAQHAAPLTPERAKAIIELAQKAHIKISVVWLGDNVTHETSSEDPQKVREAKALGFIAAVTGGGFVDLSGKDNPCSTLL